MGALYELLLIWASYRVPYRDSLHGFLIGFLIGVPKMGSLWGFHIMFPDLFSFYGLLIGSPLGKSI